MLRLRWNWLASLAISLMVGLPTAAQTGRLGTSFLIGPTWLDFAPSWGGDFGALSAQLRVNRPFTRTVSGEIAGLGIVPWGGASAIPGCVQNAPCFERKTPDVLLGAMTSVLSALGATGWRGSLGLAAIKAVGMKGPNGHSSVGVALGLDWTASRRSGLTPTLGARALWLASPIAGMRYLVLPTVGIVF